MNEYRSLLEQVRDLKIKMSQVPPVTYEEETDLLENPVLIGRKNLIKLLQAYKEDALSLEDVFDWISSIWFSDLFMCDKFDADSMASVIHLLQDLENNEEAIINEVDYCLNALENNKKVEIWFGDDL